MHTQPFLNLQWDDVFGSRTARRGLDYFQQRRIISCELLPDTDGYISGRVKGSGNHIYDVTISFDPADCIDGEPLWGECTCPAEFNCKHVCAVLRSAEKHFGAERINQLMAAAIQDQDLMPHALQLIDNVMSTDPSSAKSQTRAALIKEVEEQLVKLGLGDFVQGRSLSPALPDKPALEKERQNWLSSLKTVTNQSKSNKAQLQNEIKPTSNCVVYFLSEAQYQKGVVAQPYLSRYLKKGGFGKPTIYHNVHNCLQYDNWPASMSRTDKNIIKAAYIHDLLNIYQGEIHLDGPEGLDVLHKLLASGRCMVDLERKLVVETSSKVKGEIRWVLDDDGLQYPKLFDATTNHTLQLLPTEPPYYLKVMPDKAECGELVQVPDSDILGTLLAAPPMDNEGAEETAKALSSLFKARERKAIQLPRKVQTLKIKPEPVLSLDSIPWRDSGTKPRSAKAPKELARGQLSFLYQGQRIPFGHPMDTLTAPDDEHLVIPRHKQQEAAFLEQLELCLRPASQNLSTEGQLNSHDLIAGLPGLDYRKNWLTVMNSLLPELEQQGWTIEISDNFPFQFESFSESDWYAELDESDMGWFNLRLGINIDGKPVDLLPVLARQINLLPSLDELKDMEPNASVPIALPGGKFINIPADRLRLMAGTLLELFGDRPREEYQIHNFHAELWQELHDQLGLPWAGSEKLQELSRKLKGFKRLKKVKPSKQLQADLRPYQQHGLSWLQFLREFGLNGILADDMGLGKTLQTLSHLQLEKQRLGDDLPPSLVVCPTSLIHNWKNEANRFTPDLKVQIHHGSNRDNTAITGADLVLTSYGVIQRDFEELSAIHFHLLALDEAQVVKNPNAKGAKAIRCLKASHKLCLTGTPMENHLGELWSLFDFLMPGFLGSREQFTRYYRTPIEKHGQVDRTKKLQKRIAPFMLRRNKDLVAKELPPKTEIIRTTVLEGKQRDLYETIRASMEARVQSEIEKKGLARSQIIILDALLKMRQACCDPSLVKLEHAHGIEQSAKLDLLMSLVLPLVDEGRKILVFSQFTSMLLLIEERLKENHIEWVKLTGQTRDRSKPVQSFQNGDVPVFLISPKAGGTGLNLTAADTVIHYDPWWNPAVEDQASDRAHRIGQDKPVFVYKLVTEGTVEEKIQELKEKKKALATSLYGGGNKKKQTITEEDLSVLFEPLK